MDGMEFGSKITDMGFVADYGRVGLRGLGGFDWNRGPNGEL
jgi:hypothetical protein